MPDDFEALVRINNEINTAEDQGDAEALKRHLAPALSFRRAKGSVVDRGEFLKAVQRSGPRQLEIQSIALLGRRRALVTCVVTMPVDGRAARFDNARLFVKTDGGEWQLMGWANEPA